MKIKSKIFRTYYRNYVIAYNPKPGDPSLSPDYDFHHTECEDGEDYRMGFGRDVEDCKRQIDDLEYSDHQLQVSLTVAIIVLAIALVFYFFYWSF